MYFNTIRENKILAKISEFTVCLPPVIDTRRYIFVSCYFCKFIFLVFTIFVNKIIFYTLVVCFLLGKEARCAYPWAPGPAAQLIVCPFANPVVVSSILAWSHTFMEINHTGKCIRRFGGIYAYCRYFIDRKW